MGAAVLPLEPRPDDFYDDLLLVDLIKDLLFQVSGLMRIDFLYEMDMRLLTWE